MPLVISFVLYYLVQPGIQFLKRRGWSHEQAVYGVVGLLTLAMILSIPLMLPWASRQIDWVQEALPTSIEKLKGAVSTSFTDLEESYPQLVNPGTGAHVAELMDQFRREFSSKYLPQCVAYLASWLPSLLLIPYITFFLLKDGDKFKRLIMRGVPNAFFEKVLLLFYRLDRQMRAFFTGLMAMTFLDTITLAGVLMFMGWPYGIFYPATAFALGLLCAVLSWVPYIGTFTGCTIVIISCMLQVPGNGLLVAKAVVAFTVVRMLDDFIYTPATVGRSMSVHPLVTVLMILAGGYLAGIPGLILAMPVLGVSMVLGEIFGQVWFDERLRARYEYAHTIRRREARSDLGK